jgi:hypothetical protein
MFATSAELDDGALAELREFTAVETKSRRQR